ncbi:presenilin family intramembrane aspartyl protease PSH [Halocatena salina]|uniref:Presenilin family intramembrane aspartyl protease n=1 Tax=Halocatena salina TaxID=2934340 RepID=A0A8U0A3J5_9EURY|nr:presenilin family intramembrane aspartyl protease PSH [Halocatena salina]UPM43369.1 presenilin family intramembrane aspartyl protease [Halocatena salina]
MTKRLYVAGGVTIAVFVLVQIGAVALVEPFRAAGYQPVEDPSDPTNTVLYLLGVFVVTGVMLLAFRFDADTLIRMFIVGSSALLTYYVFSVFLPPIEVGPGIVGVMNGPAALTALAGSFALWFYPEWYVIDAAGVVIGMGAAGLFGISLGLLPALLLLIALAVYDAISVYKTEHMLTLASGMMDLKIPVVLVVPLTRSYSYLDAADRDEHGTESTDTASNDSDRPETMSDSRPERDALYIGLGDAVMPSVLVASAAYFLPSEPVVLGGLLSVPVLAAMGGTLVGLLVLIKLVTAGRPHAGLPLLNGGAIAGYLFGAIASGVPLLTAVGLTPYV